VRPVSFEPVEPLASRPHIPGYGIPATSRGMLSWHEVALAFGSAPRYWIATTDANGAPHVIQQWGAWVDGSLYFEGGSHTRWARNIARDPRLVATTENSGLAIMIEGRADNLSGPNRALVNAIIREYSGKPYGYKPDPANWSEGGLIALRPTKAFAWRYAEFDKTATRFTFTASPLNASAEDGAARPEPQAGDIASRPARTPRKR
jgi:hypothetical protein